MDKYPHIGGNYEVIGVPNMFVGKKFNISYPPPVAEKWCECLSTAGAATHSLDYRKSAGGFIHGYRYTGRILQCVEFIDFKQIPYVHTL